MRRTGYKSIFNFSLLLLLALGLAGCYRFRIGAEGAAGVSAPHYESKTVWYLGWGLFGDFPVASCNNQPIAEVVMTSNLGYDLITVLTLGFASPIRMQWRCAAPTPVEGIYPVSPDTTHGAFSHAP